jgi:hypothetical protein
LRLTVSQPVRLGIGPPFETLDQILSCSSFSSDNYFILRSKASSLTRKRVCSLQCNHSLFRSLTPNHTLPPHLRLCSLFVASYDSQGLRWKYSNPPPHGVLTQLYFAYIYIVCIYKYIHTVRRDRVQCRVTPPITQFSNYMSGITRS